jgi:Mg2+/Co2+ transporter CorB
MDATLLLSLFAGAVALLALSAFFTAAEMAIMAAPRAILHQREEQGDPNARLVTALRRDKERLIGGLLVGKYLTSIGAAVLIAGVLVDLLGAPGIAFAAAATIVLLVVFCEILPRTLALRHSVDTALLLAPVVRLCVIVLAPIAAALCWLVTRILRRFGKDPEASAMLLSPIHSLRGAIEVLAREAGDIHQERAMLQSIVELDDVEVSEIMTHRQDVVMIDIDAPMSEILDQIVSSRYTRMPLWRDAPDNIIGILHNKAVLQALRSRKGNLEKSDILSVATPPWFVPDTRSLLHQLEAFRRRRKHFAVVVDEYGAFMGTVTLEDILEEIVGDIADEHDVTTPGISLAPDGTVVVEGTATIRDLNRRFDWTLPDEEAATVAGLVLHESRQIPDIGQTFVFHDFRFEILQRKRNQITLVKIAPPTKRQDLNFVATRPANSSHAA